MLGPSSSAYESRQVWIHVKLFWLDGKRTMDFPFLSYTTRRFYRNMKSQRSSVASLPISTYRVGKDLICFTINTWDNINVVDEEGELLSTHLISLNFSSASGDGFLSGWNYSTDNEFLEFLFVAENFLGTFIAALRYAFLSSVSLTSVDTPSCPE